MGIAAPYFRQHPWQRRLLTLWLMVLLGVGGVWLSRDWIIDRRLVELLDSPNARRRHIAMKQAAARARERPELVARLECALDSESDRMFSGAAEVLIRVRQFDVPRRRGEHLDRYWSVNLAVATGPTPSSRRTRVVALHDLLLAGRDNVYVRGAAARAGEDEDPKLRGAAAPLGARLGDDALLGKLLGDDDPDVRALAAASAGLAARKGLIDPIEALFDTPAVPSDRVAAADALARLDPKRFAPDICKAIVAAAEAPDQAEMLDHLLAAAPLLGADAAGETVLGVLKTFRSRKRPPPAMALIAASRMELTGARELLPGIIDDLIARGDDIKVGQAAVLAAAVRAAHQLKLPPATFTRVIKTFWDPRMAPAIIHAAEALGDLGDPADADLLELLATAAEDDRAPVPSAAAAVALFKLEPGASRTFDILRAACDSSDGLAGDYIAWRLPRTRHADHARFVTARLMASDVYSDSVRSTAAMLLAMMARGTPEADRAAALIGARAATLARNMEAKPTVAGTYECALAILGRSEAAETLQFYLAGDVFPRRRVLTALLLTGQAGGFDHVLARPGYHAETIDAYLAGRLMWRVYDDLGARLPAFDIAAPRHVRHRQGRLCRDDYLIHRKAILESLRK